MVDEMDLLRKLKDAEPVQPHAFEEARVVLQAAMAAEEAPEAKPASRRRVRWGRRWTVGFGATALVAGAAAVALAVTSASTPGKPPAETTTSGKQILAKLVTANTSLKPQAPGNATLSIRNESPTSDKLGLHGINLFTDDGTYFWANDKKSLQKVVAKNRGGDDAFKRAVDGALYAVKGDVGTARERMAVAHLDPNRNPDDLERKRTEILKKKAEARGEKYTPLTPEQKKHGTDQNIWMNTTRALIAAPTNPQVRAGALRIMETMPRVKVTKTTTAGKPTLTLKDSWPDKGGSRRETLIIEADTGLPVARSSSIPGVPSKTEYIHSSRVTLADIKAGKF